jgi:hypothetical protein
MSKAPCHQILFNDQRYQRCNLPPGERLFRYDHTDGNRLIGTLSGVITDGVLECGHSAPFGGIDFVGECEDPNIALGLLRGAIATGRFEGISNIRIRARPDYFGTNDATARYVLYNLGAIVEACELSLGLEIGHFPSPEHYVAKLDGAARNKLRQGLAFDFVFAPAHSAAEWSACFDLLVEARRRRGAQLKISLPYLTALREIFGTRIAMYQLCQGDSLVAAALVYRIRMDWDYVVAWGDDIARRSSRVMNVLAYHLVSSAIAEHVSVMDVGISSVDGVPDDGLVRFKRSIGATTGLRLNFRLPISQ